MILCKEFSVTGKKQSERSKAEEAVVKAEEWAADEDCRGKDLASWLRPVG